MFEIEVIVHHAFHQYFGRKKTNLFLHLGQKCQFSLLFVWIYYIICCLINLACFCLFLLEPWHFNIYLIRTTYHFVGLLLLIHRFSFVANTAEVVTIAAVVWILFHGFLSLLNFKFNSLYPLLLQVEEINSLLERLLLLLLLPYFLHHGTANIICFLIATYLFNMKFWAFLFLFFSVIPYYFCVNLESFRVDTIIFGIVLNI